MENESFNKIKRKNNAFEKRIHEIDFLRGILILLVVIDHIFYYFYAKGDAWHSEVLDAIGTWYWTGLPRYIVQHFFALPAFCFVSGVSTAFSKNNWQRAGELILIQGVLFVGSNIMQAADAFGGMSLRIEFNVLAVLGWSCLLYCFIQKFSWRIVLSATIILFLFQAIGLPLIMNIEGVSSTYIPGFWGWEHENLADHMELFPYIIFFFLGVLFSRFFYKERKSLLPRGNWERPFCFVGRHTLIIYLSHQVVLIPIVMLLDKILG